MAKRRLYDIKLAALKSAYKRFGRDWFALHEALSELDTAIYGATTFGGLTKQGLVRKKGAQLRVSAEGERICKA